jgi:hypothetical protein
MGRAGGVDRNCVVASLDEIDRGGRDDPDLAAVADQDPLEPPSESEGWR